jgi:pentapeptide MXKDX repeat protein
MKNVNSLVLAMCLALGAGSVFAQGNEMTKGAMNHDETTQPHDGMKKNAMKHDAMKMDTISKGSKSSHMMKKDGMSQNSMSNDGSQH